MVQASNFCASAGTGIFYFDIEKCCSFPGHHPSCHSCGIPGSRGPSARHPAAGCGRPPGLILQQDREHHVLCGRGSLLHLRRCVRSLLWSHSEHLNPRQHMSFPIPSNQKAHAAQNTLPVCCFSFRKHASLSWIQREIAGVGSSTR